MLANAAQPEYAMADLTEYDHRSEAQFETPAGPSSGTGLNHYPQDAFLPVSGSSYL